MLPLYGILVAFGVGILAGLIALAIAATFTTEPRKPTRHRPF